MKKAIIIMLPLLAGCHFCQQEVNLIVMAVPGVGMAGAWLRSKFHHYVRHKDCKKPTT